MREESTCALIHVITDSACALTRVTMGSPIKYVNMMTQVRKMMDGQRSLRTEWNSSVMALSTHSTMLN